MERVGGAFGIARQGAPGAVGLVPRTDLVNVLEYEEQARRALEPGAFARVAGGDRAPFDRLTLQPRMMIPTRGLDLGLTLFGHAHHSPIFVGPISAASLPDPSAAALMLRGAMAAHATVVAAGATATRDEIRQMKTPVWCQAFAADASAGESVKRAVDAGCRVACVTIGAEHTARGVRVAAPDARQWRTIQTMAATAGVPVIVKGVASLAAARQALQSGADGIVFSNYGGLLGGATASILDLPAVVEAVGAKVPVLTDGAFRRGTDVLKALALGASAVLVTRPVAWGLAAYGAEGVQSVMEMLQTELARYMAMTGKPNLQAIDRATVKIHAR
jgi:isopentenyl diphosphate isomerase/L-lactate dehydrogenase-like FMN-dependent dehydrogenase